MQLLVAVDVRLFLFVVNVHRIDVCKVFSSRNACAVLQVSHYAIGLTRRPCVDLRDAINCSPCRTILTRPLTT